MQREVQAFITKELGILGMNTSKHELIEIAKSKNIRYRETPRTITFKNEDKSNMMYFIFSDSLSEIIMVDLCCTELEALIIDDEQYTADYLKKELQWSHQMKCSYKNAWVPLNNKMDANCSTGIQCAVCSNAGSIKHEAFIGESIITYVDFGDNTDNQMFCIENNYGEHVNYRKIQREDSYFMKSH